jgi:hypothetical protein
MLLYKDETENFLCQHVNDTRDCQVFGCSPKYGVSAHALPGLCQSDDAVSTLPDTYGLAVIKVTQLGKWMVVSK